MTGDPPPGVGFDARAEDHGRVYQAQTQIIHQHAARPTRTAAAVVVPVVAPDQAAGSVFVGREAQAAELSASLDPSAGGRAVVAVVGLAGVGKTALARYAAGLAVGRGWFAGGAVFTDLHGYDPEARVAPGQVFGPLLRALGVPSERIGVEPGELAAAYHRMLASLAEQGRPVLLVLDNAAGRDQIADLLPAHAAHRVLVTSRNTLGDLGAARVLDLRVLGESESVAMLDASLRARDPADRRAAEDPAGAGELARLGGRLPLALRIVASLLADDPALPVADLVAELADAGSRLGALSYEERSVRAAFDLSRRHLADRDGPAERLFRLLPVEPGPEISTEAAAVLAGEPETAVRRRLRALHRAHLIEPGTAPGRWRMHDLVALFAAGLPEAEPERSAGLDRLLRHYLSTADAADDHVRALPGQPVPDRFADREAALAWLEAERPNLVAAVERSAEAGRHDVATKLALALGLFLDFRHVTDDHLATATVAVREAAHLDPYWQGVAWDNLGVALRRVHRFGEAIDAHQQGVDLCRRTGNRRGEGVGLSNLGIALQGAGRFAEAMDAHQRAIEICRQVGDRYTEGRALNGLGMALYHMARFREAIAAHRDAMGILDGIGDRIGVGMASSNLSSALRKVGRVDEAVVVYQRAVEAFRDGGDRSGEGTAVANLGSALWEAGRFGEAIEHLARSVTMLREARNRPVAGMALRNLGLALTVAGRPDHGVEALTQAVAAFAEAGDGHGQGFVLTDLGIALRAFGRSGDARACWQRAADLFTESGATDDAQQVRRLLAEPD